jgi:hypothetical protein
MYVMTKILTSSAGLVARKSAGLSIREGLKKVGHRARGMARISNREREREREREHIGDGPGALARSLACIAFLSPARVCVIMTTYSITCRVYSVHNPDDRCSGRCDDSLPT